MNPGDVSPGDLLGCHGRTGAELGTGSWGLPAGFAMVELLVAMALGLFLTAGILQVFVSSKGANRLGEAKSRVQENGRFAVQMLAADLRGARSTGCASVSLDEARDTLNVAACELRDPPAGASACTGPPALGSATPLGYAASQRGTTQWLAGLPGNTSTGAQYKVTRQWLRGDVLVAWGTVGQGVYARSPPNPGDSDRARPVDLVTPHRDLVGGRLALITDCESTDIFTITSPTRCGAQDRDPPDSLAHEATFDPDGSTEECDQGAAVGPVNVGPELARVYNRRGTDTSPGATLRARVFPFEYSVYYVCCMDSRSGTIQEGGPVNNCNTNPGRYRPTLCRWSASTGAQQYVTDVADLRVTYDGYTDRVGRPRFLDESGEDVTDAKWVSDKSLWQYVDSARIQLLVTTAEEARTEAAVPNPDAAAATDLGYGLPADRRIYRPFDVTTAVRSSALWYVQR